MLGQLLDRVGLEGPILGDRLFKVVVDVVEDDAVEASQQRGPPISPIAPKAFAVIRWESAKGSAESGVDFERMDTNMPELRPAPQAPQKPQAPPGTLFPLLSISFRALSSSIAPPAFL